MIASDAFHPRCLDCGYEVSGIPDGRCPECGHRFTHDGLLREFRRQNLLKLERQQKRLKSLRDTMTASVLFGAAMLFPYGERIPVLQPVTFAAAMGLWVVALAAWLFLIDRTWASRSHRLLVFVIPLLVYFYLFCAVPYRNWSLSILLACAITVVIVGLRGSPLIGGAFVLVAVCVPLLLVGLFFGSVGFAGWLQGHGWTNLDRPTAEGWKPLLATDAMRIGWWFLGASAGLGAVVCGFARRALVRLRRHRGEEVQLGDWIRTNW